MKRSTLLILASLTLSTPAQAALINDYSQTDDVWNTPIPTGHVLFDVRTSYKAPWLLPAASLVYGLAPNTEIGLCNTFSGSALQALLNPYLKVQLPWTLGGTAFGLVGGIQVPTQTNLEYNAALEGVASIPLTSASSLDLGLGVGRSFLAFATLGHFNAAFYYTLPTGQTLLLEAYSYHSGLTLPSYGQHAGLLVPLGKDWTMDASLALNEASGNTTLTPQLGFTALF